MASDEAHDMATSTTISLYSPANLQVDRSIVAPHLRLLRHVRSGRVAGSVKPRAWLVPHGKNRARRMADHRLGSASEYELRQPPAAAGAYDDEVSLPDPGR